MADSAADSSSPGSSARSRSSHEDSEQELLVVGDAGEVAALGVSAAREVEGRLGVEPVAPASDVEVDVVEAVRRRRVDDHAVDRPDHRLEALEAGHEHQVGCDADQVTDGRGGEVRPAGRQGGVDAVVPVGQGHPGVPRYPDARRPGRGAVDADAAGWRRCCPPSPACRDARPSRAPRTQKTPSPKSTARAVSTVVRLMDAGCTDGAGTDEGDRERRGPTPPTGAALMATPPPRRADPSSSATSYP